MMQPARPNPRWDHLDPRIAHWRALAPTLSIRARNTIFNAGVTTIAELYAACPTLHLTPNCGKQTLQELYNLAGYVRPWRTRTLEAQNNMAAELTELGWICKPPPRLR